MVGAAAGISIIGVGTASETVGIAAAVDPIAARGNPVCSCRKYMSACEQTNLMEYPSFLGDFSIPSRA